MEQALLALRCGRLSFTTFERRTRGVWLACAKQLLRRWRAPLAVSVEDVVQELLAQAWISAGKWDPARGVPIDRYVVWNSMDKAKKWLHRQRNAYRRDDRSPSRLERPVTSLGSDEFSDEHLLDVISVDASQEERLTKREALARAALSAPVQHAPAMVALASTGDIDLAAERLLESTAACVALDLLTLGDAHLAVTRALVAVTS